MRAYLYFTRLSSSFFLSSFFFSSATLWAPKPPFVGRLRNSTETLTAHISGTKHDIDNRQVRCKLQGVCYIVSERHKLWSTNGLKLEVSFHPPSIKYAIHFIARLRRQRSTNGTYMSADLHFTTGTFFLIYLFIYLFFVTYPPNSLNGTQRKSATWSEVSAIWKRMSKIWGVPPLQIGGSKNLFGRLRNLTANLTAYIFGTKHDVDNRLSALTTTMGLLRGPKMSWTFVHKRIQTGPPFLPTLCKFCFLRYSQASHSKQNSTKLCQTADDKSR